MNVYDYFKQFNKVSLLSTWDDELNGGSPEQCEMIASSKFYFKCPRGLHASHRQRVYEIRRSQHRGFECPYCASFGQYVIDNFGEDFLKTIWSPQNSMSPFDIARQSSRTIITMCPLNLHPDETHPASSFVTHGCHCKRCSVEKQHDEQRSDLTNKRFGKWIVRERDVDSSTRTGITYWFCDCDCGTLHSSVSANSLLKGTSTSCGCNRHANSKSNHYNWKGGITPQQMNARNSDEYKQWRLSVFQRDRFACQRCGATHVRLNAHHVKSFADHEELRFDVDNGITLCEQCHSIKYPNSFHSLYGTRNTTPEQLEEYVSSFS